jgi:hypothetical protein
MSSSSEPHNRDAPKAALYDRIRRLPPPQDVGPLNLDPVGHTPETQLSAKQEESKELKFMKEQLRVAEYEDNLHKTTKRNLAFTAQVPEACRELADKSTPMHIICFCLHLFSQDRILGDYA